MYENKDDIPSLLSYNDESSSCYEMKFLFSPDNPSGVLKSNIEKTDSIDGGHLSLTSSPKNDDQPQQNLNDFENLAEAQGLLEQQDNYAGSALAQNMDIEYLKAPDDEKEEPKAEDTKAEKIAINEQKIKKRKKTLRVKKERKLLNKKTNRKKDHKKKSFKNKNDIDINHEYICINNYTPIQYSKNDQPQEQNPNELSNHIDIQEKKQQKGKLVEPSSQNKKSIILKNEKEKEKYESAKKELEKKLNKHLKEFLNNISSPIKDLITKSHFDVPKNFIDEKNRKDEKYIIDDLKYINSKIFEYLVNTVIKLKEPKQQYGCSEKDKAKEKKASKKCANNFVTKMGEKLSKLGIKDYKSFTISKYLKKLLEKFIITDNKETLSKPQLKQIYRIIDAYISPKKEKKELKMINRKISNINQETNKIFILNNNDELLDKNLYNEGSHDLCSFKNEFLNNRKENSKIFPKNIEKMHSKENENNINTNYNDTSDNNDKGIKIRKDHIVNIIKDFIMSQFVYKFNDINKSYKLIIIRKNKENNENKNNKKKANNELQKNNGIMEEDNIIKKNENEIKGNDSKNIIIYITLENKNNSEIDFDFMNSNFEKVIKKKKKKQKYDGLKESEEAKNLINTIKIDFLFEILKNENLIMKLFTKIKNNKENLWKTNICRKITEEIFERQDLNGLVITLFYSEKVRGKNLHYKEQDKFIDKIRNLGGYDHLIPNNNCINNNIKSYMESFIKMLVNIYDHLNEKISSLKRKDEKKLKQ